MIPLVDLHCHLLAGLDDGPPTDEEALAMCRLAAEDGTRMVMALAHQNEHWPANTPDRIRQAVQHLAQKLREGGIDLTVFPCAEVMVFPEVERSWCNGELLSVADRREYLLVEMPGGQFVDLRGVVQGLRQARVRPILAHPERHPELLHEVGPIEELIAAGCLVQVSAKSITEPRDGRDEAALKRWFKAGIVHFLGSDGHSCRRRPPRMGDAYRKVVRWAGVNVADRVGSTNGMAVAQGLPLHLPAPAARSQSWFSRFW